MYIPSFSETIAALNQFIANLSPPRPIPADFDYVNASEKLDYINDVIDSLVDDYDRRNIQVKQHPDILREVKLKVKDALIVHYWENLQSDDKRPIGNYTIQQVFDQIYKRAFIECIVSKNDVNSLTADQPFAKKSFMSTFGYVNVPPIDAMLQYTSTISTHEFTSLFETPKPLKKDETKEETKQETPLTPIIEVTKPTKSSNDLLLNQDKTFRSEDEAIICKITYNTEKIKFLFAQYSLLELYLKFAFCEVLTDEQGIQFIKKTGHTLPNLKCKTTETPGELMELFHNFNELLLNVEKSKEALEKNGMPI